MGKVNIDLHPKMIDQSYCVGSREWRVSVLIAHSKDLPIFKIPLKHLDLSSCYEAISLRRMVSHFKAIEACSLNDPIILGEDGEIMDGRHRIMKALFEGKTHIKAVRFDKNPIACRE